MFFTYSKYSDDISENANGFSVIQNPYFRFQRLSSSSGYKDIHDRNFLLYMTNYAKIVYFIFKRIFRPIDTP